MQSQTRDIQFDGFVHELTEALDFSDFGFAFGVVESVVDSLVQVYEAFAQAERGVVAAAAKGLVV
ncbi:MAG: hypothetical protein AAF500_21175 [Myxococcota bacterium]